MAERNQGAEIERLRAELERQDAVIKRLYYYVAGLLVLGIASIIIPWM